MSESVKSVHMVNDERSVTELKREFNRGFIALERVDANKVWRGGM
jgi:hypothetical protein